LDPEDETAISEISILPDGRVCVFGASRQVIEALAVLDPDDSALRRRIERLETLDALEGDNSDE
jgi:Tol biopolymer transport system component